MIKKTSIFPVVFLLMFAIFLACSTAETAIKTPEKSADSYIILEGKVREVIVSAKKLSEYRYYVINTSEMKKEILFNDQLTSYGFKDYINKKVTVKGERVTGYVGWRKIRKEGIKVLEITESR